MRPRRYRPSLDGLPPRLAPSGDLAGIAPAAQLDTLADPAPPADDPAEPVWSGPMMPSDADFDLTPWTLAEMAPPADPPF